MTVKIEIGVTEREANCRSIDELKSVAWASPLLEEIRMQGGLKAPRFISLMELLSPSPHSRSDEESQMLKFAGILSDKACTKRGLPS
jgi:hypothetical protein